MVKSRHPADLVQELADYILTHCSKEIDNENAVEVAIRVMGRMAAGIKEALKQPWIYEHGIAHEALSKALGEWE